MRRKDIETTHQVSQGEIILALAKYRSVVMGSHLAPQVTLVRAFHQWKDVLPLQIDEIKTIPPISILAKSSCIVASKCGNLEVNIPGKLVTCPL